MTLKLVINEYVVLTAQAKFIMNKNGAGEHVSEFGDCVGRILYVDWVDGSTEERMVVVEWTPSNSRFTYPESSLTRIKPEDLTS